MIQIDLVRRETPGTGFVAHFNNAGASLMPQVVLDTVTGYLEEEARRGGYETAGTHPLCLRAPQRCLEAQWMDRTRGQG